MSTEASLTLPSQFGWGCFGAVTPWFVRALQVVAYRTDVPLPPIGLGSVVVFVGAILFGGAMTIVLHSHNRWVAWYHGATHQILLAAIVGHAAVGPPAEH